MGDFDLFVRSSLLTKFYAIDEPLSNYRLHESNYTNMNTNIWTDEFELWLNENKEKFEKKFRKPIKKSFVYLKYLKIKFKILDKKYKDSFIDIIKFPICVEKFKLLFILILIILKIKTRDDFK